MCGWHWPAEAMPGWDNPQIPPPLFPLCRPVGHSSPGLQTICLALELHVQPETGHGGQEGAEEGPGLTGGGYTSLESRSGAPTSPLRGACSGPRGLPQPGAGRQPPPHPALSQAALGSPRSPSSSAEAGRAPGRSRAQWVGSHSPAQGESSPEPPPISSWVPFVVLGASLAVLLNQAARTPKGTPGTPTPDSTVQAGGDWGPGAHSGHRHCKLRAPGNWGSPGTALTQ